MSNSISDLDEKLSASAHVAPGMLALYVLSDSNAGILNAANASVAIGRDRLLYAKPGVGT